MCSGLGKGAIWAQVVIMRNEGQSLMIFILICYLNYEYHYLLLIIFGAH